VINRGVSGNKIIDLASRWERDVIAMKPDVLSIMIGINDVWHEINPEWRPGVPIEEFRAIYRRLMMRTHDALPQCQLVLCEPTVIWPPQDENANDAMRPYVDAVNEVAKVLGEVTIVHLHDAFNRARELRPDIPWCPDGVHPSSSGHMLIAREWLRSAGIASSQG
jgi:lysophospholipase L1-like esterase